MRATIRCSPYVYWYGIGNGGATRDGRHALSSYQRNVRKRWGRNANQIVPCNPLALFLANWRQRRVLLVVVPAAGEPHPPHHCLFLANPIAKISKGRGRRHGGKRCMSWSFLPAYSVSRQAGARGCVSPAWVCSLSNDTLFYWESFTHNSSNFSASSSSINV